MPRPVHAPPPSKPLLAVLAGERRRPAPVWLMRQAGRYLPEYRALRARTGGFLDLCYHPRRAAEASLQPVRRFDLDAAIVFSDILVVPHALGRRVEFKEGTGPVLDPLADGAEICALDLDGAARRLEPVYEAVCRLRAALPGRVAAIGFAGAPWTIACYMIDGGASRDQLATRLFARRRREDFARLIETLTEAVARHLAAQIEAGAETVQIFDSWAGVLAPGERQAYSLRPIRRIAEALREAAPAAPVIVFPRGVGAAAVDYAALEAAAAISIDTTMDPVRAARELQPLAAVQGNLDPALLVAGGPALEEEARRIADALGGGAHVFNLGHGVLPETPPDHVARLVAAVRGVER